MSKSIPGSLLSYLHKPYPLRQQKWIILILIPLFVSLFMVTFQPFGLQMFNHENKNLLLLGYGLVTFIVLFIDMYIIQWILPKLFAEKRWYIISEIVYLLWIVLTISLGNYLYSNLFHITRWIGLEGLLIFIGFTFAVSIIPITGIIVFSYNYMLRKNLRGADEMTKLIKDKERKQQVEDDLVLVSENNNQSINTTAFKLLCIESVGNYVNIWRLENGKIIQHMLRNTIRNMEDQLKGSSGLFRCHRAYIINLRYVEKTEGNSQGYQLTIRHLQKQIPVSRNYTKEFNQAFRSFK